MIQVWLIVLGIALAVSNGFTWRYTSQYYSEKAEKLRMEQELANVAVQQQLNAKLDAAIDWYEDELAKKQKVRVVIKKEIERVIESNNVYVNCKLDDAGVRIFNAAAEGVSAGAARQGDATVPAVPAQAQERGNDGRPAGNVGLILRDLPRVPPATRSDNSGH